MQLDRTKVQLKMSKMCVTQRKLAELSGISRQTVSYAMNGKCCSPEILGRILKVLGVEPEEIIKKE